MYEHVTHLLQGTLHNVHLSGYLGVDFKMQLAHAWDDGFFALCVKMHSKRWIFPGETVNTFGEFIQVILVIGEKS